MKSLLIPSRLLAILGLFISCSIFAQPYDVDWVNDVGENIAYENYFNPFEDLASITDNSSISDARSASFRSVNCDDPVYIRYLPSGITFDRTVSAGITGELGFANVVSNSTTGEIEVHYDVNVGWDYDAEVVEVVEKQGVYRGNFIYSQVFQDDWYFKEMTLVSNDATGTQILNLDPATSPHNSGPYGTVTSADLMFDSNNGSAYINALGIQVRNGINAVFGFDQDVEYNLYAYTSITGKVVLQFECRNASTWLGIDTSNPHFVYFDGTSDQTKTTHSTSSSTPSINGNDHLPSEVWWTTYYDIQTPFVSVVNFDQVDITEPLPTLTFDSGSETAVCNEPILEVMDYCQDATFDWALTGWEKWMLGMNSESDHSVDVTCPDGCVYNLTFLCGPVGTGCDDGDPMTINDEYIGDCQCQGTFTGPSLTWTVADDECGQGIGSIDVTPSGGTPPYFFNWSNGESTEDLSDLVEGTYDVTVTDDTGSSSTESIAVANDVTCCDPVDLRYLPSGIEFTRTVAAGITGEPYKVNLETNTTTGELEFHYEVTVGWDYDNNVVEVINDQVPYRAYYMYRETFATGYYYKELTVTSNVAGSQVINIDPYSSPYLSGPYGTVTSADLVFDSSNTPPYLDALEIVIRNGIKAVYNYDQDVEYELDAVTSVSGKVMLRFYNRNAISSTWLGIDNANLHYVWSDGTSDFIGTTRSSGAFGPQINPSKKLPSGDWWSTIYYVQTPYLSVVNYDEINITNALPDVYLNSGTEAMVCDEPILEVIDYCADATFDWSNTSWSEWMFGMDGPQNYTVEVACPDGCIYVLEWLCGPVGASCDDGDACTTNDVYVADCECLGTPSGQTLTYTTVDDQCTQGIGSIDLTVTGGVAPYTFLWSNGATTEDLNNVVAGSYDVVVTDDQGCEVIETIVVADQTGPCCTAGPDLDALLAIYNATNGSSWTNRTGWEDGAAGTDCEYCNWYGVVCDTGTSKVTQLNLVSNGLGGSLPMELGDLDQLVQLKMNDNNIGGSIPEEIGNLNQLTKIKLGQNILTGSIPATIGNISGLLVLDLNTNALTGNLPSDLGLLSSVVQLHLFNNGLTGGIPTSWTGLSSITSLHLGANQLDQSLDNTIGQLTTLTNLNLSNNNIPGVIPTNLGSLSSLINLYLGNNDLIGEIPSEFGNLNNIEILNANFNQLSGPIPPTLGQLSNLTGLFINDNNLHGCIPDELNALCGINALMTNNPCLSHNGDFASFCAGDECTVPNDPACPCSNGVQDGDETDVDCGGSCPECEVCPDVVDFDALMAIYDALDGPNWTNNTGWIDGAAGTDCDICNWEGITCYANGRVKNLVLTNKGLDGVLPPEIGDLDKLRVLNLQQNSISGSIPPEIGNLDILVTLNLRSNQLTGSIPVEIGNMTKLKTLYLYINQLSGNIPTEIENLTNMVNMRLFNNDLVGSIPSGIGNLTGLKYLYLYNNNLTGAIPDGLGNCTKLIFLYLHNNDLTGTIPGGLGNSTTLRRIWAQNNELDGQLAPELGGIPTLQYLYLYNNDMTGQIPSTYGDFPALINMYLYNNDLTGGIPSELGNLPLVRKINFRLNDLSGPIPGSLGNLNTLTEMRLDRNNLSGCIPPELSTLCSDAIDVRFNPCLSHGGIFADFCAGQPCVLPDLAGCPCVDNSTETGNVIGERGSAEINKINTTIFLTNTYQDPVIIAGPTTADGCLGTVVNISNVTNNSFEARYEGWSCSDAENPEVDFTYVVVEAGEYIMNSGTKLKAVNGSINTVLGGIAAVNDTWNPSIVLTQITTNNEPFLVATRLDQTASNPDVYDVIMQESLFGDQVHGDEDISLIVAEIGTYTGDDLFEFMDIVGVGSSPTTIGLSQDYCEPLVIAKLASMNDSDPAEMKLETTTMNSMTLFVDEDSNCGTTSNSHVPETVHAMVFNGPGLLFGDPQLADLEVVSINAPSAPTAGTVINVDVDIANNGPLITDPFRLSIYISEDNTLDLSDDSDDYALYDQWIPGLPANDMGTLNLEVLLDYDLEGSNHVIAFIDSEEEVIESNEDNNTAIAGMTITLDPCSNGVQDGGEEGVDCGGSCGNACPEDIVWQSTCYDELFDEASFDREINVNLAVGMIEGFAAVTPSGASTYSIPIRISPGTQKIVPTISLEYNSMARNGLLGYGWNLNAGSTIARTNRTINYDGVAGPISLECDDPLTLEGLRLIPVDTSTTDHSRASSCLGVLGYEHEDFTRVIPIGSAGSGADHFEVISKEGLKSEFGNTPDSKIIADDGSVLIWAINKVYDQYGNYMEYVYSKVGNELLIQEIKYTGNENTGVAPYNLIKFNYVQRGDKNVMYVADQALELNSVLDKVEVFADGELARMYDLCYAAGPTPNIPPIVNVVQDPMRSYLVEIFEYGSDQTKFNSTRFKYGEKTNNSQLYTLNDIRLEKDDDADYLKTADFNADGLDDIALFRAKHEDDIPIARSVEIYLKNDINSEDFTYIGNKSLDEYLQKAGKKGNWFTTFLEIFVGILITVLLSLLTWGWFLILVIDIALSLLASAAIVALFGTDVMFGNFTFNVTDLNGDAREEVVLYTPNVEEDDTDETVFTIGVSATNQILIDEYDFTRGENQAVKDFLVGDYDGDTLLDFMITLKDKDEDDDEIVQNMIMGNSRNDYTFSNVQLNTQAIPNWYALSNVKLMVCQLDGDGKNDLLAIGGVSRNGSKALTFDFDENHTATLTHLAINTPTQDMAYPRKDYFTYIGDFNGDGKTDLLSSTGNGTWEIGYFNGNEFDRVGFPFVRGQQPKLKWEKDISSYILEKKQILMVADLNNDGKSDILTVPHGSKKDASKPFFLYYSSGKSFVWEVVGNPVKFEKKKKGFQFDFGDFNGDGIFDIVSSAKGRFQMIYVNENTAETLLTDVLDGFNNRTSFEYLPMASPEVYTQTNNIFTYNGSNQSSISPSYPLNNVYSPIRLVKKMKSPNGLSTGNDVISYNYENAIFHREGRGFLGFTVFKEHSQDLNRENVSLNAIDLGFNILYPRLVAAAEGVDGDVLGQNENISFYEPTKRNPIRYFPGITSQSETNAITGQSVETVYEYTQNDVEDFQNIKKATTKFSNLDGSSIVAQEIIEYDNYVLNGSYMDYLPEVIKTTKTYKDELPFEVTTHLSYDFGGKIQQQIEFVGLTNPLTTTYSDQNGFGQYLTVTVDGNDIDPRISTVTVDDKGRFYTSLLDPVGHFTEIEFEPKWGNVEQLITANGNTSTSTYDAFGRSKTTTSPEGNVLEHNYSWQINGGTGESITPDDAIFTITTIEPGLPDKTIFYNSSGKPRGIETETYSSTNTVSTLYSGIRYNKRGLIVETSMPYFNGNTPLTNEIEFDEYNRPVLYRTVTGGESTLSYSANLTTGDYQINNVFEDGTSSSVINDAAFNEIKTIDGQGNVMDFEYYAHGGLKRILLNSSEMSTFAYDDHGRQTINNDPNIGELEYAYNAIGEMIYQNNNSSTIGATTAVYDELGRIKVVTKPEGDVVYDYFLSGSGTGKLEKITNYNGVIQSFGYDILGRVNSHNKQFNGESLEFLFDYNSIGQLISKTYPSGFEVVYDYDLQTGNLKSINDGASSNKLFEVTNTNNLGQIVGYSLGNGIESNCVYDQFGNLEREFTVGTSIFDYSYTHNINNGLVNSRTDNIKGLSETFQYDNRRRLTSSTVTNQAPVIVEYHVNGNIKSKSDVSAQEYIYDQSRVNALVEIPEINIDNYLPQTVNYNSYNQPTDISSNGNTLNYTYGPDENRFYSEYISTDPNESYERYYAGNFERQITSAGISDIHYLEKGIIVVQESGSVPEYFYSYTDHLGSIINVTDESGNIVAEQSFDAWGSERNPLDWSNSSSTVNNPEWLYRGYTGHEMLSEFNLINMNGRLFDPIVGRMLSVDSYAGLDRSIDSYDRYSYVKNSPLNYVDPSGEAFMGALFKTGVKCFKFGAKKAAVKFGTKQALQFAGSRIVTNAVNHLSGTSLGDPPTNGDPYQGPTMQARQYSTFQKFWKARKSSFFNPIEKFGFEVIYETVNGINFFFRSAVTPRGRGIQNLDGDGQIIVGSEEGINTGIMALLDLSPLQLIGKLGKTKTVVKVADNMIDDVVEEVVEEIPTVFKSLTKSNYRHNLQVATQKLADDCDAHHVFPKAERFLAQWKRVGLNIHDPGNMLWWQRSDGLVGHQKQAFAYNKDWDDFFALYPEADLKQIYEFGLELVEKYNIMKYN